METLASPSSIVNTFETTNQDKPKQNLSQETHKNIFFKVFFIIDTALFIGSLVLFLFIHLNNHSNIQNQNTNLGNSVTITSTPTPSVALTSNQYIVTIPFDNKIQQIDGNLRLLAEMPQPDDPTLANPPREATYYSAGIIPSGKYKGQVRIVVVTESLGIGGTYSYMLTTKDGKTYTVDGAPDQATNYSVNQNNFYHSSFSDFQPNIVTQSDDITPDFPNIISLGSGFSLSRQSINIQSVKTGTGSNTRYDTILPSNYSSYISLNKTVDGLKLYTRPKDVNFAVNSYTQPNLNVPSTLQNLIQSTTEVIAVNSTGLGYVYTLVSDANANSYTIKLANYQKEEAFYEKDPAHRTSPSYPGIPNLGFNSSDVSTTENLYTTYNMAFPGACSEAGGVSIVLQNMKDSDFKPIGKENGIIVYTFRDNNNPLLQEEYNIKVASFKDEFKEINKVSPPTYSEYVSKNPLLIMKDPFGRWVMVGEFQYYMPGGCGKPAIYLYSPKPIKVNIQFQTDIKLDVNIPAYHNGWNVLTNINGTLTDLQPQYTDCKGINTHRFGSEYAYSACTNNNYPYIYWSGQSINSTYPIITNGWIVKKEDITSFMNQKLDYIGLTAGEKSDMLSYWLPTMLQANTPYYRISFLQTEDMNKIAPMNITPKPDNFYRIFLDYLPLQEKPIQNLKPETLEQIHRNGFTYVEWGGLKRTMLL